jgi:hypothetical protein
MINRAVLPQKLKHRLNIGSSNSILFLCQKRNESRDLDSILYAHVQSSIGYDIQKVEVIQVSTNRWLEKENVVYPYNGILLSPKKKRNSDVCYSMHQKWMNRNNIMPGEITHSQMNKHCHWLEKSKSGTDKVVGRSWGEEGWGVSFKMDTKFLPEVSPNAVGSFALGACKLLLAVKEGRSAEPWLNSVHTCAHTHTHVHTDWEREVSGSAFKCMGGGRQICRTSIWDSGPEAIECLGKSSEGPTLSLL